MGLPPGSTLPRSAFALALVLFLASGATSLVYEVAWTRKLLLLLGSTSTASAVVLSLFLGGLGVGGFFGGRLADRSRRPLALYGLLELLAAGWALLVPLLLAWLEDPYVSAATGAAPGVRALLRIGVAAVAVFPGAALVGATLPVLVRFLVRADGQAGPSTAWLYGVNTLGAVGGALWAGFDGIFSFGVVGASYVAAYVAAGVGFAAFVVGSTLPPRERPAPADAPPTLRRGPRGARGRRGSGALVAAALCGFVALGLEASSVRILVFFVEGFTASFASMLAVFLTGLGIGSLLLGPRLARGANPARAMVILLALGGAAAIVEVLAVPGFEDVLRSVRGWAYRHFDPTTSATAQHVTALAGSALLLLAPAILLGATFPLAVRWAEGSEREAGRAAGRVYLANSVGSVAAPLLLTFYGFRAAGPLAAWTVFGILALAAGLAGWCLSAVPRRAILGAAVFGLTLGVGVPWAVTSATPEVLVRASHVVKAGAGDRGEERTLKAAISDDVTTASYVRTAAEESLLYTDDFQAAATGRHYPYMKMLGHLPALLAASDENAMVIAFGTGTTAGAVAVHSGVKRLEIVETSRAVLDLADKFRSANGGVLDDVRVRLRVEDGRNALLLHAPDLDILTLEPLLPFTPAALPFYTRDFYELARDRLREGGILCQWVPVHAMRSDLYEALLGTFFDVFPDGTLWFFEQSTVLIGRKGEARPDVATVQARAAEVEKQLKSAGFMNPAVVASACVATGRRVIEALKDPALGVLARRIVTDEDPFPEAYPSPRAPLVTPDLARTLAFLAGLVEGGAGDPMPLDGAFAPPDFLAPLRDSTHKHLQARAAEADAEYRLALAALHRPDAAVRFAEGLTLLEDAARGYGEALGLVMNFDRSLQKRSVRASRVYWTTLAKARLGEAHDALTSGDGAGSKSKVEDALALARRAYELQSPEAAETERPAAAAAYAQALMRTGRCREAEQVLEQAANDRHPDPVVVALFAAVRNRRLDRDDLTRMSPDVAAFMEGAAPCREDGIAPVAPHLAKFKRAFELGRAPEMRAAAGRILFGVRESGVPAADAAKELREAVGAGTPEVEAVRAAYLRVLDPTDDQLATMLRSTDDAQHSAALSEAATIQFDRLHLEDVLVETSVRHSAAARRTEFARAAGLERGRWALDRLADLLEDPEASVRAAAFHSLTVLMSKDQAGFGYDPTAAPPSQSAAITKIRAWLASRP